MRGARESDTEGGGTAADRHDKRDERVLDCIAKRSEKKNGMESEKKTYKGREALDGTHLHPPPEGKKGGKSMAIAQHSAQHQSLDCLSTWITEFTITSLQTKPNHWPC